MYDVCVWCVCVVYIGDTASYPDKVLGRLQLTGVCDSCDVCVYIGDTASYPDKVLGRRRMQSYDHSYHSGVCLCMCVYMSCKGVYMSSMCVYMSCRGMRRTQRL